MDHAARISAVAKHANRVGVRAVDAVCLGKAECRRERGGAMPRAKAIVLAFGALGKSAHAAALTQSGKPVASSRDQFMNIALVSDVEDDMVTRRGKHAMDRQGKLDHSKIGRKVSAMLQHALDQKAADLACEHFQLLCRNRFEIVGTVDCI